jgi:predicted ribosomally synthesized peptide with SipW-like signal peptide
MSRNYLTAAALTVGALGLVGIGAGASFTDAVTANQQIQTGTVNLAVSSSTGTVNADQLTCTAAANKPSTGSATCDVKLTNTGTLPISKVLVAFKGDATDGIDATKVTVSVGGKNLGTLAALRNDPASKALDAITTTAPITANNSHTTEVTLAWDGLTNADAGKALTNAMTFTAADL